MKMLPIGTTGTAAYDIECMVGTIKKGACVTITGIDDSCHSLGYDLTDEHGFCVTETGFDSIIPDSRNQK